jgi:hypothetical protein
LASGGEGCRGLRGTALFGVSSVAFPGTMSLHNATSPPPLFGHVTPWSTQLAFVFALYAVVTLVCLLVFFVGRWRRLSRSEQSDSEGQALMAPDDLVPSSSSSSSSSGPRNPVLFVWHLLRLSPTRLELACGADAAHYLRFTRMALAALAVMSLFGLAVLLPVYLGGEGTMCYVMLM